jgi:GIY-YIG catalytic domain
MPTRQRSNTVYRFFNSKGDLLYVGVAGNPGLRLRAHAKTKSWWSEVATATFRHFATYEEAVAAEDAAIKTESPKYNSVGVPGSPHEHLGVNAASAAWSKNAQRLRFQKYVHEIRDSGFAVDVQTADLEEHPDYTVEAVRKALRR